MARNDHPGTSAMRLRLTVSIWLPLAAMTNPAPGADVTNPAGIAHPVGAHPVGANQAEAEIPLDDEWPMLAHDPARSGATAAEVRPPFERAWYRLFPDEGILAGVQPVVACGRVFVGTLAGVLHAIDARSGRDAWAFRAGGPILHAAAVSGAPGDDPATRRVCFGAADATIYALRASDGSLVWSRATAAAVWNAPLVKDGVLVIGSRDGTAYALEVSEGADLWSVSTGAPILSSPALDAARGRVYVASEDLRVRALDFASGDLLWTSPQLPGASFRGYHPVVAPDGSVLVTVAPVIPLDAFETVVLDMVREIFGDFASWRHTKEENARLRRDNFELLSRPGTHESQLAYLRRRLAERPAYQTFFVLSPDDGRPRFVAPIVYAESMNGTGAPPVVTPRGETIVKFQALLRSRYEHYSPFLNVGRLDTATGHISPILDETRTYGWHDSLLLVHDEQCQLAVGGRVLFNAHQDNVNALDLDTRQGYGEPLCRGIHEPRAGEAVAIWARILRGEEIPPGKEWLARGTAPYGGGSAIDVSVSIAGDSFYYIPTHEVSAGAAVVAYRRDPKGTAARERVLPPADLTEEEWRRVQEMPWDWDLLGMPRLDHVLAALPGPVPGTVAAPLVEEGRRRAASLSDEEVDRFIWEAPRNVSAGEGAPDTDRGSTALRDLLEGSVRELLSRRWRPLVLPAGKHPREAYRVFTEPTETVLTLALAYPHLGGDLREAARRHVDGLLGGAGIGKSYDPSDGEPRSTYEVPEALMPIADEMTRDPVGRLYPIWLWAHTTGDWRHVEGSWKEIRSVAKSAQSVAESARAASGRGAGPYGSGRAAAGSAAPDCGNGVVAGLIAAARMAARVGDGEFLEEILPVVRERIRDRVAYEVAHPRGGLIRGVPVLRTIFARWRHLTPEVGRLLDASAGEAHRRFLRVVVDHHRPTWWLAWNVETLLRNECAFGFPATAMEIFSARAWVAGAGAEDLARWVDIPWSKADEYFIQKVALALSARSEREWERVR